VIQPNCNLRANRNNIIDNYIDNQFNNNDANKYLNPFFPQIS